MQEKPSIQQLENFMIYGRVRNFATAAHIANITQSAFSFQMKKLEELLGVQLITRSNRGSDLTREGEYFLQKITPIIEGLDEAIGELRNFSGLTVTINVGALMSMGDVLMNRHVSYFKDQNIDINVYNLEAKSMMEKLASGEIDIASTFLLPQMNLDGYEKDFFYKEELVFYAPNLHFAEDVLDIQTVAKQPMVDYSLNYFMHEAIESYFKCLNLSPDIEARLSTPYAMIYYCLNNNTGALLSKRLLNEIGEYSGYYRLKEPLFFDTYLIYKQENPKINSMKIFVDYVLQLYAKQDKTK